MEQAVCGEFGSDPVAIPRCHSEIGQEPFLAAKSKEYESLWA
jgi:hypothetical protein